MIFTVDHPPGDVSNQKKTQILIEFLAGTKKVQLLGKKSFLRFRGFRTRFLLLTTPYVMFEAKKNQVLLVAHKKEKKQATKRATRSSKKVALTTYVKNEKDKTKPYSLKKFNLISFSLK